MEFGKLEDINGVNWAMPVNDPGNASRLTPNSTAKIYFGSPAWGEKRFVGKIYPSKSRPEEFLYHYSRNFNCIELNTTHYRIPDAATAEGWLAQVPANFKFCPKLHKDISHARNGLVDKTTLNYWLTFVERMNSNLGPCFIQLHEMFSYMEKALLFRFLENWPNEYQLNLELRHPSWFQKGKVINGLADYLYKRKIGLVITDVAGRRDVLHSTLSTNYTMIRLIGNNLDPSDRTRLEDWTLRIKEWEHQGLKEIYLMIHQPDDILTIEFAKLAQEVFAQAGLVLPTFKLEEIQGDLL